MDKQLSAPIQNCTLFLEIIDSLYKPIANLECQLTYNGTPTIQATDGQGVLEFVTNYPNETVAIAIKKLEGGYKDIGVVISSSEMSHTVIMSPTVHVKAHLQLERPSSVSTTPIAKEPVVVDPNKPIDTNITVSMVGVTANITANILITKEMIKAIAPGKENDQSLMTWLNIYAEKYEVNTPLRIAHFLAQCAHESEGFKKTEEDGKYSLQGALATWNNRADQISALPKEKLWFKRDGTQVLLDAPKQPGLFNAVYGNRKELGNLESGDGYRYRGRGYIQLTGKFNYKNYTGSHNNNNPNDQKDFVENPDLLKTSTKYATESAFYFWKSNSLNSKVDNHATIETITSIVNGKSTGLPDRIKKFNKLKLLLKIK